MLYIIKDGLKNCGCIVDSQRNQQFNTNLYILTYDLKSNVGYIEMKEKNSWKLNTSVGCVVNDFKSWYHDCESYDEAVKVLKTLCKADTQIIICNSNEISPLSQSIDFSGNWKSENFSIYTYTECDILIEFYKGRITITQNINNTITILSNYEMKITLQEDNQYFIESFEPADDSILNVTLRYYLPGKQPGFLAKVGNFSERYFKRI